LASEAPADESTLFSIHMENEKEIIILALQLKASDIARSIRVTLDIVKTLVFKYLPFSCDNLEALLKQQETLRIELLRSGLSNNPNL
jgi:hypothetical protein